MPVPVGIVGWWAAEGSGADSVNADNGALMNGAAFAPGLVGQSFGFDGVNDYVRIPRNPGYFDNQITVDLWMKAAADNSMNSCCQGLLTSDGYGLEISSGPGSTVGVNFYVSTNGGFNFVQTSDANAGGAPVSPGEWHHIAGTYDGVQIQLYVDGAPRGNPVAVRGAIGFATSNSFITIGSEDGRMAGSCPNCYSNRYFKGLIDEADLFNRALAPSEIAAIYDAGAFGKCPLPPKISLQPQVQSVSPGQAATFTVTTSGSPPFTYQWTFYGTNLPGATDASLTILSAQRANDGPYAVRVSNGGGSIISEDAWLIVIQPCFPAPSGIVGWWKLNNNAVNSAGNDSGFILANAYFAPAYAAQGVVLDGTRSGIGIGKPPYAELQDFTIEAWVQRASSSLVSSIDGQDGLVFSYGSGGYGFGLDHAGHPLLTQIDISSATADIVVNDTNFHHLAVTKLGPDVVFYVDGVAYPRPSYPVAFSFTTQAAIGIRADNYGNTFLGAVDEVSLYNRPLSAGEIQGIYDAAHTGKCRIPLPPFITLQPASQTTSYVGSNVTFFVSAGGDSPLSYQWFFNGTVLPGKTSTALALTNIRETNSGSYFASVSNTAGTTNSSTATLTVKPLPDCAAVSDGLISWWRGQNDLTDSWDSNNGTQPARFGTVQFANAKVGRGFNLNSTFVQVPDAPSLRVSNAFTIDAWLFPSNFTALRTIVAKYDVSAPFSIPPSFQTNCGYLFGLSNGVLFISVSRTGSGSTVTSLSAGQPLPTSQWTYVTATYDGAALRLYTNGVLVAQRPYTGGVFPGTDDLGIGGIPGSSPSAFSGLLDEVALYNRPLSDGEIASIYDSDIVGRCFTPPVMTSQPQDLAIPQGEDALFKVSVFGTRPLRYQWRFQGANLVGATNSTLLIEKVQSNHLGAYLVVVTNSVGTVTSSPATLTMLPPPSCVAPPTGLMSWWPAETFSSDIIGTNNPNVFSALYVTGKVGRSFSFNGLGARISVPSSSSLNFSSNSDFSIEGWIKALPPAPGSGPTNPNVPIIEKISLSPGNAPGFSFSLNQGRLAFSLSSAPNFITNFPTYVSSGPDLRDSMFHHIAVSLNRNVTNGGALYLDGQPILVFTPGHASLSNSSPLNIGAPTSPTGNSYFNGLIDELSIYGRALSASEIMAIRQAGAAGKCIPPPVIVVQPTNRAVMAGSSTTFRIVASGFPTLNYQWQKGGTNVPGPRSATYTIPAVVSSDAGDYTCIVSNNFGSTTSVVARLAVNQNPTASNMNAATKRNQPLTVGIDKLLAFASDPDGDPLTLSSMGGVSTNGGSVVRTSTEFTYTPVADFVGADSFWWTVSDGRGGSAMALVLIEVRDASQTSGNMLPLAPIPNGFRIRFAGIPGRTYSLQRAPSPSGPWTTLSPVAVGPDGICSFDDTNAPPDAAYYRTVYP